MKNPRAYSIGVHEKAEFSLRDFEDRLELTLENQETGEAVTRPYYKLETGIGFIEASKINLIVFRMHRDIGLDFFESEN